MSERGRPELDDVITSWRRDALVLRRNGDTKGADLLERCAAEVVASAEDWLTWLNEGEAELRSGFKKDTLRARFPVLEREGHAQLVRRGVRLYRACAIPRRASAMSAADRGRLAAREVRSA